MNKQLVLVEFRNTAPFVYQFESDKPITMAKIVKYMENQEDFDPEKDSLTFLDEIIPTKI